MVYRLRKGVRRSEGVLNTIQGLGTLTIIVCVAISMYIVLFYPDVMIIGLG